MASMILGNIKRIIRILADGGKAEDVRDFLVTDFRKKSEGALHDIATYERLISENNVERPDLKASLSVRRAQQKELQEAIDLLSSPGS
jgi:hypothetical protein